MNKNLNKNKKLMIRIDDTLLGIGLTDDDISSKIRNIAKNNNYELNYEEYDIYSVYNISLKCDDNDVDLIEIIVRNNKIISISVNDGREVEILDSDKNVLSIDKLLVKHRTSTKNRVHCKILKQSINDEYAKKICEYARKYGCNTSCLNASEEYTSTVLNEYKAEIDCEYNTGKPLVTRIRYRLNNRKETNYEK